MGLIRLQTTAAAALVPDRVGNLFVDSKDAQRKYLPLLSLV